MASVATAINLETEIREHLRQDVLAVWREFELTGLHATQEEIDAWLLQLEAGQSAAPPPCHV